MPAQITASPFAEREQHYVYCDECDWRSHSLSPYSNSYPHELAHIEDSHNARFHDRKNPPRFVPGAMYMFTAEDGEMDWAWAELDNNEEQVLFVTSPGGLKRELTPTEIDTAVPA